MRMCGRIVVLMAAVAGYVPLVTGETKTVDARLAEPAAVQLAAAPRTGPAATEKRETEKVRPEECFRCHSEVRSLFEGGAHGSLGCGACHGQMSSHLKDARSKPTTDLNPEACGSCHKDQFKSSMQVNWGAPPRMEKGMPQGRSPLQNKLLAPHGFTVEHNEPRSHAFMVTDMMAIDRFAGGRYRYTDAWGVTRPGKTWEVMTDTGKTHPGLAKAGNSVCLQCKTSDLILGWGYLGDPSPKAKWSRTSDVNEVLRAVQNPVGCIHCHDPHGGKARIVRDALIEAVERDGATPYATDRKKNAIRTVTFRDFRKIAMVSEKRSNLLCGQCHVEYACNPGLLPEGEGKVTMEDRKTNYFPFKNARDVLDQYTRSGFRDFRHAVTGARLVKLQHPELETFWGSRHERAGVTCVDCHMGKVKNAAGKSYTNHGMLRPGQHPETACIGCHEDSTPQEMEQQMAAVRNYTRGKIRQAEHNLSTLIDTYALAARQGVSEEVLSQARRQHEIAHVLWEWWTSENSDGWHNPELARETLLDSIAASRKGVDILQEAMKPKTGAPVIR